MKIKSLILVASAFLAVCTSCQKDFSQRKARTVSVAIEGLAEETATKSAGYSTVLAYESVVRSLEILVFSAGATDETSYLELYHPCTASEISALSVTLKLKDGDKKIYAVSNGPKDGGGVLMAGKVKDLASLKAISVDLSANVTSGDGAGFVAFGGKDVLSTESSVTLSVSRLASRVALRKVTNNLPSAFSGDMTVKRAWIGNVVGNQNLAGNAAPATFYNKQSRKDKATQVSTEIINGTTYTASLPSLTYADLNETISSGSSYAPATPKMFYFYKNPSTVDPNGFAATYTEQKTVLVLQVAIPATGKDYYYNVVLPDGLKTTATLGSNLAYTVDLSIAGLGEIDPNKPVSKTSVNIGISLSPWVDVTPYSETI